jgi:hypothetical protein
MLHSPAHHRTVLWIAALLATSGAPIAHAADSANGTLAYKARGAPMTAALKHVWLVKGPDAIDPKKTTRKLIFSSTDIGAKVTACKTMNCVDADLGSGMTVDLDSGPRLNYWIVLDGQKVQYSGTAPTDNLKLTTNTPGRLAGKLAIDGVAAGGPKIDVDFDATMLPEITRAR